MNACHGLYQKLSFCSHRKTSLMGLFPAKYSRNLHVIFGGLLLNKLRICLRIPVVGQSEPGLVLLSKDTGMRKKIRKAKNQLILWCNLA